LSFNGSAGRIYGYPYSTGTFNFTVQVSNGVGTAQRNLSIVVTEAPAFSGKVVTLSSALNTNRRIDITGKSTDSGAQAIIWDSTIGANQRFVLEPSGDGYYFIKSVNSGLYLDIYGGNIADGANVIQWSKKPTNNANQQWAISAVAGGNYTISSRLDPNYVLDVNGASPSNGTRLIIWQSNGGSNQRFKLDILEADSGIGSGGQFLVRTFAPGNRSIDVFGGSTADGARIILYDAKPTASNANQRFTLQYNAQTGYYFILTHSGQSLDVYGGSTAAGAQVIQWPLKATNNLNQQWAIVPKVPGSPTAGYYIYAAQTGLSLDCYGGSGANESNVITWGFHGGSNQTWSLTAV
jgi:hypothetical protein